MGHLRLEILTNTDLRFYPLLGPYLARRDLVTALGGPLYDDPGKHWWVAFEGEAMMGFGAVVVQGRAAHFCSDYVLPEYRRQGLHARLIAERLTWSHDHARRATATATIAGAFGYRQAGFTETRKGRPMKHFVNLERAL